MSLWGLAPAPWSSLIFFLSPWSILILYLLFLLLARLPQNASLCFRGCGMLFRTTEPLYKLFPLPGWLSLSALDLPLFPEPQSK